MSAGSIEEIEDLDAALMADTLVNFPNLFEDLDDDGFVEGSQNEENKAPEAQVPDTFVTPVSCSSTIASFSSSVHTFDVSSASKHSMSSSSKAFWSTFHSVQSSLQSMSISEAKHSDDTSCQEYDVSSADIILANHLIRGRTTPLYPNQGTLQFRQLIQKMAGPYQATSSRKFKTALSTAIVELVCSYGGRFLREDEDSGGFYLLNKKKAREKAVQALRENEAQWTTIEGVQMWGVENVSPAEVMPDEKTNRRLYIKGQPGDWDILCGRGGGSNNHAGNKRFRGLVEAFKVPYKAADAARTEALVYSIVRYIHDNGGRFLIREDWENLNEDDVPLKPAFVWSIVSRGAFLTRGWPGFMTLPEENAKFATEVALINANSRYIGNIRSTKLILKLAREACQSLSPTRVENCPTWKI